MHPTLKEEWKKKKANSKFTRIRRNNELWGTGAVLLVWGFIYLFLFVASLSFFNEDQSASSSLFFSFSFSFSYVCSCCWGWIICTVVITQTFFLKGRQEWVGWRSTSRHNQTSAGFALIITIIIRFHPKSKDSPDRSFCWGRQPLFVFIIFLKVRFEVLLKFC